MLVAYRSKAAALEPRNAAQFIGAARCGALMLNPLGDLAGANLGIYTGHADDAFFPPCATRSCQEKHSYFPQNKRRSERVEQENKESVKAHAEVKLKVQIFKDDNN
jgi:hypothetical protein